jgi:putative transposase
VNESGEAETMKRKLKTKLVKNTRYAKQDSFGRSSWEHYLRHGGELRKKRKGRKYRPLSTKDPLHLVLKVNKSKLKRRSLRFSAEYLLVLKLTKKYARKFYVKIEQISVQNDHVHMLVRAGRRSQYQNFFRVLSGQIAQSFQKQNFLTRQRVTGTPAGGGQPGVTGTPAEVVGIREKGTGLWLHRPFSRVVKGWRAFQIVRNYIQLNELEATGRIPYRKERLRGLTAAEWDGLWSNVLLET